MRITTEKTINMATGEVVSHSFYEYTGFVAQLKKGRKEQESLAAAQRAEMDKASAEKWRQLGLAEPTVQELEQTTGPGQISRYAAGQLAQENDNIANTFAGLRKTAIRSLGARGLAPDRSGLARTSMNALGEGESAAGTDAFRTALSNTLAQRMAALNFRSGQSTTQGQQSLGSGELSSSALMRRSQMGSTLGDIGQGVQLIGGIASDLFAPGSGALSKKSSGIPKTSAAFKTINPTIGG